MTQEEAMIQAIKDAAIMRSDLFWCLGKLRGLGYPAEKLEKQWGIEQP